VELVKGRLSVLESQPEGCMAVRQVIPVSIGKNGFGKEVEGDRRTPVDVYRPTLFREDEQLIDFYGLGAYPLNYHNLYDRQRHRPGLENTLDFEHRHKAIIDRFGRYPTAMRCLAGPPRPQKRLF
jgi:hypothetical protein